MDAQTKQQVVERVKQATNILVTVSNNPSVDQLAACIGLTLLLNKMGKHATAVFSGQTPSTIEFLQPKKTLEANTDSLRDFIISLDKAKADKLRYKVEDQFVRIFITPYKTSISEKDLQFSQGEYNVDVVVALGVQDQAQLDAAITAHGKILHDAVVISVNSGSGKAPQLGQINWQDATASSLAEMIVSISEAFGSNLLDAQMATAFLTGIVAETARFSNPKTSPKVMTMSAQLMAAGANQQLIVSKLEPPKPQESTAATNTQSLPNQPPKPLAEVKKEQDGTLNVDHGEAKTPSPPVQDSGALNVANIDNEEIAIDNEGTLMRAAELLKAQQSPHKVVTPPSDLSEPQGMPPPHALLGGGSAAPAFTATTQSGGEAGDQETGLDPLAENNDHQGGLLNRAADVTPPEDQARNAVEQAFSDTPDTPATAPPFPPPLTPTQGVVIPPPPIDPAANNKSIDNTTL